MDETITQFLQLSFFPRCTSTALDVLTILALFPNLELAINIQRQMITLDMKLSISGPQMDYMQIRNALIILMKILPHFPVLGKIAQIIERKLEKAMNASFFFLDTKH